MSRGDMMRRKRSSYVVGLLKLIKRIDNYQDSIISVFEGEDSKYYGSRIDIMFSAYDRKNLTCKGKKNVLTLREKVEENPEISQANIIYFVDSDFEARSASYNVYTTPCHSIENLYASKKTLDNLLKDELGLCSVKDLELINDILGLYEKFELLADEALVDINAFIMAYSDKEAISLNLNDHDLKTFLTINPLEGEVSKIYSYEDLLSIFSIDVDLNRDDFENAVDIINSSDQKLFCRGKYRLEYFRIFLNCLFSSAREGGSLFSGRKIKPKITLSKNNIISDLAQYAVTPTCLTSFLREYEASIAA